MELKLINIVKTDSAGINNLSNVASKIVKQYYDPIIGPEQNDYMIKKFQSPESLTEQISHGYRYYISELNGLSIGFMAFYPADYGMYLSKFYIDKQFRGNGIGKRMLNFLIEETKKEGLYCIRLNVNKNNLESIAIYKHFGFSIIGKEKNDIGSGFFMDDYVMEYKIK